MAKFERLPTLDTMQLARKFRETWKPELDANKDESTEIAKPTRKVRKDLNKTHIDSIYRKLTASKSVDPAIKKEIAHHTNAAKYHWAAYKLAEKHGFKNESHNHANLFVEHQDKLDKLKSKV